MSDFNKFKRGTALDRRRRRPRIEKLGLSLVKECDKCGGIHHPWRILRCFFSRTESDAMVKRLIDQSNSKFDNKTNGQTGYNPDDPPDGAA